MTQPGDRPRAIGYVRVSTNAQGAKGFGLAAQREQIEKYCDIANFELVALHTDVMKIGRAHV